MGQSLPKPGLRPFLPADVPLLAEIFRASIEELTGEDYSEAQQEAWASRADDEAFATRLAESLTLVATMEGSPLGFISLKDNTHIDLFFVHPAVAGQGVGSMLYEAIEKLATARAAPRLTADVSDTALAFFQKRGFQPQRRNTVTIGDEWLANTTMDKPLAPANDGTKPS
jgi:putative acetyltransferase